MSAHNESIYDAAKDGNVELLRQLLTHAQSSPIFDINRPTTFRLTPLHVAVNGGHAECVKLLLGVPGIDPNCKDMFGRTPLEFAATKGSHECLALLLGSYSARSKLDVNASNKKGQTPLIVAAYHGHVECIKLLLVRGGADVNAKDLGNNTPLHHACSKDHVECVQLLLKHGADPNAVELLEGNTPLHVCAAHGSKRCLTALLADNRTEIDKKNVDAKTAFDLANLMGRHDIADIITREAARRRLDGELIHRGIAVSSWTPDNVALWLTAVGFGQYADTFRGNDISGVLLHKLSLDTLKTELGIASYGHREQILKAISALRTSGTPSSHTATNGHNASCDVRAVSADAISDELAGLDCPHIEYEQLEFCELLGMGYFGEVKRAIWKATGTEVAVKIIFKERFSTKSDVDVFKQEVSILSKLRHPNVIQFLGVGVCASTGNRCIVTEFMRGGSLYQLIHERFSIISEDPFLRMRLIMDIVRGMAFLHSRKIVHRDLTSKNLLLDHHLNIKIADFGLSRLREEVEITSSFGCIPWLAPEVFKGSAHTEAADVFSFGVVLYEILSGEKPHKGHEREPLRYAHLVAHEGFRPKLPDSVPPHWARVIQACWHDDPLHRPSFSDLLTELGSMHGNPSGAPSAASAPMTVTMMPRSTSIGVIQEYTANGTYIE